MHWLINITKKVIYKIKEDGLCLTVKHYWRVFKRLYRIKVVFPIERKLAKLISEFLKKRPLLDVIIIESHNDFDCNGGAFYNYLVENQYNRHYKIVWMLKNKLTKKLPENVKAYYVSKFSFMKCYYTARAKFILFDDYMIEKVREDQTVIYCTHGGVTFKNVKGLIVVPDTVDYILSASKNYDPYICENYSIPYPNDRMLHLGYPSNDVVFSKSTKIEQILGGKYKKKILWMPTFRKSSGLFARSDTERNLSFGVPLFDTEDDLQEINEFLLQNESLLIVKLHPMQDLETVEGLYGYDNILVLSGQRVKELEIDTYELMAEADALLSDYSSAAYSFILKNEPIGFVLEDLQDYKLGFSVDDYERFLPGDKIYTIKEFTTFIENVVNEVDPMKQEREDFLEWLYEYCDDGASVRLAEFMNL